LARTLFTLEQAGITDAYVVLGYEAESIREAIERIGRFRIRIHWLYNEQWEKPNGLSALAAEEVLGEPFVLTMCDHIFDPKIVAALQGKAESVRGVELAVDRDLSGVFDLDDATKVQVQSGRIKDIGKAISGFNAVDTGVFLATPALFGALREACREGKAALADGVQKLADQGLAGVTEIDGLMWHDVDTARDAREAERKLLATVRKPSDGIIARYLNRPVSTTISRRVVTTAITPSQVTFVNLVLGLVAAGLAAVGGYLAFLVAGVLFHITSVVDGTDGEVAKLTFRTSAGGELFDTISDNITYLAFLLGLIVGVQRSGLPDFYHLSGIVGLAVALVTFVNLHFYLMRQRKSGSFLAVRYGFERGSGFVRRVLRVLQYLGKRDMMAFLVLLLAIMGQMHMVLPSFCIGATVLLLPASIKVNFDSLRWQRRPRARRPVPTSRAAPVWVTTSRYWFVEEERERVSESVHG
jgi:CDP-L-myo-inositol myo-inositolphosphotransferase